MSQEEDIDRRKRRRELLRDFESFFMVGEWLSLSEWRSLSIEEKACAVLAVERIITERSIPFVQDSEEKLRLITKVDGGDTLVSMVIDRAMQNFCEKRERAS